MSSKASLARGQCARFCFDKTRYLVLAVSTLALTCVIANSLSLNATIICMTHTLSHNESSSSPQPLYSADEKTKLFSAVAVGSILGILPLTYLNNSIGTRVTFSLYGLISGAATLVFPLVVPAGFVPALVARTFQGVGVAISQTSLGAIVSTWSSLDGAGVYISFLSMHLQLGAILVMPLAGSLCGTALGWSGVYYILGTLSIVAFGLFLVIYRDDPASHFLVSESELEQIKQGRTVKPHNSTVPYLAIVTDLPIIGILVSCLGGSFALQIMSQYGPTYLNKVLDLDVTTTGFAAAFPFCLAIIVKVFAGPLSDRVTCVSERGRIIFFNTMAQLPIAVCFLLMASVSRDLRWLIQVSYSLVNSFSGLNAVGVAKCVQLVSQHHAHFIMTMMSMVYSVVWLVLPLIVNVVAPGDTYSQWNVVLYIMAGIVVCCMTFFNVVCQVKPRKWTQQDQQSPDSPPFIAQEPGGK